MVRFSNIITMAKFTLVRHLPPRGAYEVFRFSNLPPRYLRGLSKPPAGAYRPWSGKYFSQKIFLTMKIIPMSFRSASMFGHLSGCHIHATFCICIFLTRENHSKII